MLTLNKRRAFPKKMYLFVGSHLACMRCRINLSLFPVVIKRLQSSFWAKRTQCINAYAFRIPFQLHWQITMAFLYNMSVVARISFYRLSSQK